MAPVIRISNATYERLKAWAEPFEDKPEDVLRRILDIAERQRASGKQEKGHAADLAESYATPDIVPETVRDSDKNVLLPTEEHVQPNENNIGEDGDSMKNYGVLDLPGNFFYESKRARGAIARGLYLEHNGLKDAKLDGRFVYLPGGKWTHVAYSSLNENGAWFFGADKGQTVLRLRDSSLENFVFLCGQENGTAVQASLAASRLGEIIEMLSTSRGQLKFNVRHVGGGKFALVFDGGRGQERLQ